MNRIALLLVLAAAGCITAYNRPKVTATDGAPAVEKRPDGCNVDIVEDGQKLAKKSVKIGHIVLEWPKDKIAEQGPDGAMKTLKAAACESGAFAVVDMRAMPTAEQGLVYEGDLVTLVGDDGKPVNPKQEKPPEEKPAPPPSSSGW